jgi:hypothetical protein
MYLKIVLRYLDLQRGQENQTLYFKDELPELTISDAEVVMNKLEFEISHKSEIRFQNIFQNNKIIGLLVSIVCP